MRIITRELTGHHNSKGNLRASIAQISLGLGAPHTWPFMQRNTRSNDGKSTTLEAGAPETRNSPAHNQHVRRGGHAAYEGT